MTLTADRAVLTAREAGDALALAEAYRMASSGYRRTGRYDRAVQTAVRAADQLAADRTAPRAARASHGGNLLATAAYTAAKHGNRAGARELIRAAHRTAEALGGERCAGSAWFGPRQVALHEVSVHQVLGDPEAAVKAARALPVRGLPRERAARLCIDVARAYEDWGRPEECYRALLSAERAVPEEVRRESIRELTRKLLPYERRLPGIRDLARRTAAVAETNPDRYSVTKGAYPTGTSLT
ncbi:hypothetical protein OIE63_39195 (plasmid) [Streptomyces sp. NBC_01795]|uniref:hypothetical protein n=1 Tax=unclassified Streptomyces TaxID=2593676 RepID=UPI002DD80C82|nr:MULTISPECIES: hypothetical protein [unclassified Streptomyces]WSA97557.1 hypothetical protein OIE63_39195 [Streptomyces sp. NBC_01795]WSB82195.1 hypothetical protein OHB04_41620 [Streptomyces sp. NBC_01775]WSS18166.1 hypothetical protein OG533_40700 [Streptomyces sp. NBC_01186]